MAEIPFSDFATNPSNPYYLHPNENPSLTLVTPPLDHSNYISWSRSMRVALISKNKLRFIDGTFVQPAQGHLLHDPWLRCNNMVLSWLQRSISENIAQSILWIDQAHAVWKNLETRFAQGDIFKVSDLQDDLSNLHQGTLDVSTYFTKLTSIWEQIDSLRPTRDCTCAIPCTCGAATDLRKYKDQDRVLKFLKGLTDSFATVRSQIFLLEPIPSLEKTFSMVLGQERRSHVPLSDSTDISSMAMAFHPTTAFGGASSRGRGRTSPGRGNFPPRTCTHCGRHNHTNPAPAITLSPLLQNNLWLPFNTNTTKYFSSYNNIKSLLLLSLMDALKMVLPSLM
ncbi:uncharacterized protein LOC131632785 [Vicia villosa]|uniref:uncharacterized protein LOC131621948 n=1 Tax=Vicia villosa TaxID=3911 RepID=UPI00273A7DA2|nr:uncharacterized protein LOC131621948 [Vicia villosa]XP_058759496.1 uncharacterized protein LOC131632785 [Vicia villosa]